MSIKTLLMPRSLEKTCDVAVIGGGFAGRAAVQIAVESGRDVCLITERGGASAHFSGAFDLCDPRATVSETGIFSKTWPELFAAFVRAHPDHLYARCAVGSYGFAERLLSRMAAVLGFYGVPFRGDGVHPVVVFSPVGRAKPTAFALPTHAALASELGGKAVVVSFPYLSDYPLPECVKQISRYYDDVAAVKISAIAVNRTAPLLSLAAHFDRSGIIALADNLKPRLDGAKIVFMPPVLGIKFWRENHAALEKTLGVRVVELLSVLPSVAGLRVEPLFAQALSDKKVSVLHGKACEPEATGRRLDSLLVRPESGEPVRLRAREFVLATGKFLGGGVVHQGSFKEPLFGAPLFIGDERLSQTTNITQTISPTGMDRQKFMSVGVRADTLPYDNLKACGQVRTGFDFTRDRCGFGASVAGAMALA